ncbi:MAG: DUF748 domain-containing protein [Bacteroidetes bacterium]|nr:DUF748 domain-containing protein [Bacteroidota bacterium]
MKIADTKFKKAILITIGSILLLVAVVILFASPIGKYLGKKYGEKYTGRQIKMGLVYVNPFTGYVHISNLVVYESRKLPSYPKGDSIFFSADGVSANLSLLKLLSKTIEISEITVTNPKGIIIQDKDRVNFSDWIVAFAPKKTYSPPSGVHFSILKITLKNGEFHYHDLVTPINYYLREVNIESTGKRWNSDTLALKYSFVSGPGTGTAKGNFSINFKNVNYRLTAVIHKFDLKFLEQYLDDLVNYGTFRANLDADIKATGSFKDLENLNAKGLVAFNEFHIGKKPDDDYAAFDQLVLQIIQLNPKNHKYSFDSLSLVHPYFKYERYDSLDNLQMMFGKNGTNLSEAGAESERFNLIVTIARYIKGLVKNFFVSDYRINRLAIYRGHLRFSDFSVSEKFTVSADPVYFLADSINRNQKRVTAVFKSGIKPYGNVVVTLSINPKNKGDFDMQYHILKIPVSLFNPYLTTYTSFPLDRGTLEVNGIWNVRDENIQSVNHLLVIDPRVSKRLRNKDSKWIPLPLIMSLVRERGNVIDYEIPITGDLKNPKFHLHDVLMDLLTNIFVKPATGPYRMEVRDMETEIEQSFSLTWKMRQRSLTPEQEKFVLTLVDFLEKDQGASIAVHPAIYADKEKEQILFFEARKKYFASTEKMNLSAVTESDSIRITKMSVKDLLFVHYLNKMVTDTLLFTLQDKCSRLVGPAVVDAKFKLLDTERENTFMLQFKLKGVQNRVHMYSSKNDVPYNGFSFYKITYKGDLPESLVKAYRKMNELNDEGPRQKYKKERKQNKVALQGMK